MAYKVASGCIGCGACEFACLSLAISQSEAFPVVYRIDPLKCNDCARCVPVCPVDVIAVDPRWAVCYGRGCPLTSVRYEDWQCSQGQERCEHCGSMLWRTPDGQWVCSQCRLGEGRRGASCPKTRQVKPFPTSSHRPYGREPSGVVTGNRPT